MLPIDVFLHACWFLVNSKVMHICLLSCSEYGSAYSPSSPQIQWFWRAVRTFDHEQRVKLVQFITGTGKIPVGGFAELVGMSGPQKFNIHKDRNGPERLPQAHTWCVLAMLCAVHCAGCPPTLCVCLWATVPQFLFFRFMCAMEHIM